MEDALNLSRRLRKIETQMEQIQPQQLPIWLQVIISNVLMCINRPERKMRLKYIKALHKQSKISPELFVSFCNKLFTWCKGIDPDDKGAPITNEKGLIAIVHHKDLDQLLRDVQKALTPQKSN